MGLFNKLVSVFLVLCCAAFSFGNALAGDALNIVCTSFPCYDFIRAVAGGGSDVQMLIKPGAEVHSYEPAPADVMAIAGCDLFVYIGGESDAWVLDILDSFGKAAPRTLRFFDCIEAAEADHEHAHEGNHEHEYDEHIWTSQDNALRMVDMLSTELCEIDPDGAESYIQNAADYKNEIFLLSEEIQGIVKDAKRSELVFADRFPFLYFANEYGLEWSAAFPSCASESEPSAKTIAELIERVKAGGIPVVYKLEMSSGKTADIIAMETGAKVMTFHSIQNVTDEEFSSGETYITLMRRNIEALREGLN